MKRFLFAIGVLFMLFAVTAFADVDIRVEVNGMAVPFDQPPMIQNDRTLVPVRAICDAMGIFAEWEAGSETVMLSKDDVLVTVQIEADFMTKNGEVISLDAPAVLVGGRTLVPVRAFSEAFGAYVGWESSTSTVYIEYLMEGYLLGTWNGCGRTQLISGEIITTKLDGYHFYTMTFSEDGRVEWVHEHINGPVETYWGTYDFDASNGELYMNFTHGYEYTIYGTSREGELWDVSGNCGFSLRLSETGSMVMTYLYGSVPMTHQHYNLSHSERPGLVPWT